VTAAGSSFPTYLWHYLLARLIYDHLGAVVVIAIVALLLLTARRRR
jgi:Na+/H+ antiporter NhaA